jgi:hypothetical protein
MHDGAMKMAQAAWIAKRLAMDLSRCGYVNECWMGRAVQAQMAVRVRANTVVRTRCSSAL